MDRKYSIKRNRQIYIPSFYIPDLYDGRLLAEPAEVLAKNVCDRLSKSQLRRFFGELRIIENKFTKDNKQNEIIWKEAYPLIQLLKAKVVYNSNRDQFKNDKPFKNFKFFIEQYIKKIDVSFEKGFESFKRFIQLFEAIVGYGSQYVDNKK